MAVRREDSGSEASRILQEDFKNYILNKIGSQEWLVAYLSNWNDTEWVNFYSVLIPNSIVEEGRLGTSWDLSPGEGHPGCVVYSGEDRETKYFRFGNDKGIEPLVLYREFNKIKPNYLEVLEEFRLFHNLWHDERNNKYVKIHTDGNEEDIIIVEENQVRIKSKAIRQFLAIREMHLSVNFDIYRFSNKTLEELGIKKTSEDFKNSKIIFNLTVWEDSFGNDYNVGSRLCGKKLIAGVPKEKSGFWPYEEEKEYADFIIGIDDNGDKVYHTSNSDKLANNFGANPGAPHYLTPVFFRRDVLTKYYSNPEKYSVGDSYLSCGGLWGLRIDNNLDKFVMVFLGDLGRDLPHSEQIYWKSFNIPPESPKISEVYWKRSFAAQFSDPEKADLLFKHEFEKFHEKWKSRFGWPLFKELSEDDRHFYQTLRIPLTGDQAEFDQQVLALAKILVDSLNEKEIQKFLTENDKDEKGISKFEKFLISQSIRDFEPHIKFLKDLYELRSSGVGHRKSKNYVTIARVFRLKERDLITVFEDILKGAIELLRYLEKVFSLPS